MKHNCTACIFLGLAALFGAGGLVAAPAADSPADQAIARIHSIGPQGWGTDPSGRTFKEIWNFPVTAHFTQRTAPE